MTFPPITPDRPSNLRWLQRFTMAIFLGGQVVVRLFRGKFYRQQLVEHMVMVGPASLNSVLLTNFFAGMIFTVQTARSLSDFGAVNAVGGAFGIAFCRELAPILTACVIAGQAGSAFAAEIGSMRVSEQIDALQMLKTDPVDYLVLPRVLACGVMVPVMTVLGLAIGMVGGIATADFFYHLSPAEFLSSLRQFLELKDLFSVVLKSMIFGALLAVIGCNWGLTTTGGVRGVGRSTTAAVVTAWVLIFMINFVISLLLYQGLDL
ncbi:MAG: MlaE family lipid ABC transporter permease subunit [Leptolyngbyaceae cyanobacterium SL_7_1]|nr:MlaE family lipid ABC transporter permease subunit [Leptolyngbyaceae cyanobacterium SL_7_1]